MTMSITSRDFLRRERQFGGAGAVIEDQLIFLGLYFANVVVINELLELP